jgi:hypothetical protein
MKALLVQPGQSLFDIAVICYGDVTGIVHLLDDNKELKGPTDRIYPGQMLLYREEPIDLRRRVFLEDYQVIATISAEDMPEGIGFWRLDEYVVSKGPLAFTPGGVYSYDNPNTPGTFIIGITVNYTGEYRLIYTSDTGIVFDSGLVMFIENVAQEFAVPVISTELVIPSS